MSERTEQRNAAVDLFDLVKEFTLVITLKQLEGDEKVSADVHLYHPASGFETSRRIRASDMLDISKKAQEEAAGIQRAVSDMLDISKKAQEEAVGIRRAVKAMKRAGRPVVRRL